MDIGGGYIGSGMSQAGSSHAGSRPPKNSEAGEAFLLSQATSTAMVAARSILLTGGTEETALKTAKAAAQSVLSPTNADAESLSVKSPSFLRRRKAKRQAEVVASMALMSAASNVRSASHDWDTNSIDPSVGSRNIISMPFNPNFNHSIVTRPNQDEPSVLSTSTRSVSKFPPPRTPTKPNKSPRKKKGSKTPPSVPKPSKGKPPTPPKPLGLAPSPKSSPRLLDEKPPKPTPKKEPLKNEPNSTPTSKHAKSPETRQTKKQQAIEERDNDIPRSINQPVTKAFIEDDAVLYSSSDSNDNQDNSTLNSLDIPSSSSGDDEETVDTMTSRDDTAKSETRAATAKEGSDFLKKHIDPVLFTFTNAFNAFSCGPLNAFVSGESESESPSNKDNQKSSREARDDLDGANSEDVSGDETDAEQNTLNSVRVSYDHSDLLSTTTSGSTADSGRVIQQLNMSSSSEGEIQVRSSIRDTMEKIVSKSKRTSGHEDRSIDRTWLSYELRQDDGPESLGAKPNQAVSSQSSRQMPGKTPSPQKKKKGWFRSKQRKQKEQGGLNSSL